jgi:acetyl-CoA synthetase
MTPTTPFTETIRYPKIENKPIAGQPKPNLDHWDAFSTQFNWDVAASELNNPTHINKAAYCVDNHTPAVMQQTALIWVNKQQKAHRFSFDDMRKTSNQIANGLTSIGVKQGDRVFVYLDRVPELYQSILGILKTGAIAGPLFSAFGPEAILDRLQDSEATVIITSPSLKPRVDDIKDQLPNLKHIIVVDSATEAFNPVNDTEHCLSNWVQNQPTEFKTVQTRADDGSVMHYTSGTTGKPKGALHKHGALISQRATAKYVLDLQPNDIYWCTADPGWVTGTAYGIFGPWSQGITQLVYEGGFNADTWYQLIEDYNVTVWYTAPTAIRMLMKSGVDAVKRHDLSTLRHLCSVGEPLNPEAVQWGLEAFGLPFHDTWWQTETGCMHICNVPTLPIKPGSMGKPFPGVTAGILDDERNPLPAGEEGHLALRPESPSMFKTYWGQQAKYESKFKNGWYLTGDRAVQDEDGYFWFIGRDDDVINTAGHLVGPFEVESALVEHPDVAEAAVIGKPDPERLEIIKAFVALNEGVKATDEKKEDIRLFVRNRLAAHAYPREIEILDSLPKTRSGKIMRRLLKARELGLPEGDTSTLEE